MSHLGRLKRSVTFILLFTVLGSITGFLLRAILTRALSVADYGLFYAVYAFIFFVYSFRDLGVGNALMKFIPEWLVQKKRRRINDAIWHFFLIQAVYTAILIVLVFIFRHTLAVNYFGTSKAETMLLVFLGMLVFEFVLTGTAYLFTGFQANGFSTSIGAVRMIIVIIASIIFLKLGFGYMSPVWAYGISAVILAPLYLWLFKRHCFKEFGKPAGFNSKLLRELVSYGKYFVIASTATVLLTNVDSLLITYFLGVEQTGLYSVAITITSILVSAGSLFLMVLLPLSSELHASKKDHEIRDLTTMIYKYFFILTLPFIGIVLAFPKEVLTLAFGVSYGGASDALRILIIGSLAFMLSLFNLAIVSGIGKAKEQSRVFTVIAITNLVLNLILIPVWGITGAATATAIAYGVSLLLSILAIKKYLVVHAPIRAWIINFLFTGALIVAVDAARHLIPVSGSVKIIVVGIAFFVSYGACVVAFGLIRLDELKRLLRLVVEHVTSFRR